MGRLFNTGNQANAKINVDADISGAETTLNRLVNLLGVVRRSTDIKELNKLAQDMHYLNSSLNQFAIASGIGFAAFTAGGIKAADSLKVFKAQMTGITGSQAQANEMMKQTIALSNQLKVPLTQVTGSAGLLASALKLNNQDISRLNEAYNIATRLAIKQPFGQGGTEGAAYSISEAYAGQYRSLATRFNITQDIFRKALKETGDPLKALDKILNELGITTQVAIEANQTFENSFKRLGDSVGLLANTALTPFLENVLIPIVDKFAEMAVQLQQNAPRLTAFGSSAILLGLALIPAVRGLTEVIKLTAELKKLSLESNVGGGLLNIINPNQWQGWSKGGLIQNALTRREFAGVNNRGEQWNTSGGQAPKGFALLGVAALGAAIGAAIAANLGPEKNKTFTIGGAGSPIWGQSVRGASPDELFGRFVDFLHKLLALWPQVLAVHVNLITTLGAMVLQMESQFGVGLDALGKIIAKIPGLEQFGKGVSDAGVAIQKHAADTIGGLNAFGAEVITAANNTTLWIGGVQKSTEAVDEFGNKLNGIKIGEEQVKIFDKMQQDLSKELNQYNDKVYKENHDYWMDQQKENDQYNAAVTKANSDFAREETQRQEDLNARIAKLKDEQGADERSITIDHQKKISELTKEFNDDQEKKLRQHQLEMARMEEDHQHALEVAAAHLDATAIIDENYNYGKKRQRAEEDFNLQNEQQVAALNQRIALEKDHYKESIKALKKNTEDKIKELQDDFRREKLQRQADFSDKLKNMKTQHDAEMQRLYNDHIDKLNQLDAAHKAEMSQLQQQAAEKIAESLGIQNALANNSIAVVQAWWDKVGRILAGAVDTTPINTTQPHEQKHPDTGGFATGINFVPKTALYKLHTGERVIDSTTAAMMRASAIKNPGSAGYGKSVNAPISLIFQGVQDFDSFERNAGKIKKLIINTVQEALA